MVEGGTYHVLPQVLSSMAISCGSLNVGGWMAFSAVAIPKMIAETQAAINATNTTDTTSATTYTLEVDLSTGSWIASLFFLGTILGCLTGGLWNSWLGPRRVFLLASPLALASRLLAGVLFGTFQANGKVYSAEIARPEVRGAL